MKLTKTRKTYCPRCKKHTTHNVQTSKQRTIGTAHPMSHGSRAQARFKSMTGNSGRYSRPPIKKRKMYGRKQSKKSDLRFECSICKKSHAPTKTVRAKKIEFK